MADRIALIVTDAPPLITLAAAGSLDYLFFPALPVLIPDAVFLEATSAADKLGAKEIVAWYRSNLDKVRVEPTEALAREVRIGVSTGERMSRNLGELAALELVRDERILRPGEAALLLSDDRDVQRFLATDPANTVLLTTWDYVCLRERHGRIQSADQVFSAATDAGRNAPRRSLWDQHDPEIADQVAAILGLPRDA